MISYHLVISSAKRIMFSPREATFGKFVDVVIYGRECVEMLAILSVTPSTARGVCFIVISARG